MFVIQSSDLFHNRLFENVCLFNQAIICPFEMQKQKTL